MCFGQQSAQSSRHDGTHQTRVSDLSSTVVAPIDSVEFGVPYVHVPGNALMCCKCQLLLEHLNDDAHCEFINTDLH